MPRFRDTASFGKRQEFRVIAELMSRDFDVYVPLVDDQAIDLDYAADLSRNGFEYCLTC